MKKFTRRLKLTAPLILAGLLFDHSPVTQPAQALVGGPFDDDTVPGVNADGTYSGTISGHNLIGIVTFGVSSSQETNGRFSVFHEGFVHYGAATGIADLQSRRVAGSLLGVAALAGAGTFGGGVNVGGAGIAGAAETAGAGTNTANTGNLTVRSGLEGSFIAKMKGYPRAIKFEGDGILSTNANTAVVSKPPVSPITGMIDAYRIFFPTNGVAQSQSDTVQNDASANDQSEDSNIAGAGGYTTTDVQTQRAILRTQTPFHIRGSRTSRTVYSTINNYTGVVTTTIVTTPVLVTPFPVPPGQAPVATPVPPIP